jgi:cob(I)alamin adenosyltransferase
MKIYTKTGDKGTTRLVDGAEVEKFDPLVEAYGTVDELNSAVGLLHSFISERSNKLDVETTTNICSDLLKIQHWLFNSGSLLATQQNLVRIKMPQVNESHVLFLENKIDAMMAQLAPLKNFVLPGGNSASSQTHMCRTICRRAERHTAQVTRQDESLAPVLIFLNRLSDYFFTLARYMNHLGKTPEIVWNKDTHV